MSVSPDEQVLRQLISTDGVVTISVIDDNPGDDRPGMDGGTVAILIGGGSTRREVIEHIVNLTAALSAVGLQVDVA